MFLHVPKRCADRQGAKSGGVRVMGEILERGVAKMRGSEGGDGGW